MQRSIGSSCIILAVFAAFGCDSKPASEPGSAPSEQTLTATAPEAKEGTEPAAAEQAPAVAPLADPAARAELGKPAPAFTLPGVDGKNHALADLRGKTVVLEWFNPDCPFVKFAHTKGPLVDQAKQTVTDDIVWLSINSGGEGKQGHGLDRNKQALSEYGIANPVLLDATGAVGKAYGAQKTPHMFVVDAQGVLVYRGGIDNAPIGTVDSARPRYADSPADAVVNYVRGALEDMKHSRALRLPDTPPYGCTVKYSS